MDPISLGLALLLAIVVCVGIIMVVIDLDNATDMFFDHDRGRNE